MHYDWLRGRRPEASSLSPMQRAAAAESARLRSASQRGASAAATAAAAAAVDAVQRQQGAIAVALIEERSRLAALSAAIESRRHDAPSAAAPLHASAGAQMQFPTATTPRVAP